MYTFRPTHQTCVLTFAIHVVFRKFLFNLKKIINYLKMEDQTEDIPLNFDSMGIDQRILKVSFSNKRIFAYLIKIFVGYRTSRMVNTNINTRKSDSSVARR